MTCDGGPAFGGGMNGLRDVVCALRWIKQNIRAFGASLRVLTSTFVRSCWI